MWVGLPEFKGNTLTHLIGQCRDEMSGGGRRGYSQKENVKKKETGEHGGEGEGEEREKEVGERAGKEKEENLTDHKEHILGAFHVWAQL